MVMQSTQSGHDGASGQNEEELTNRPRSSHTPTLAKSFELPGLEEDKAFVHSHLLFDTSLDLCYQFDETIDGCCIN